MQMAPLTIYCEHCGAENTTRDIVCFACQESLQCSSSPNPVQPSPSLAPLLSATSTASDRLLPGSLLKQRYEIEGEIGQGGFSVVYVARDVQQKHKKVAIKQINLLSLTPRQIIDATDTYNREVAILSRLKHPNLPGIYEHFTDPHHWYLVMDYIEGETLEDYLQKVGKGYLPLNEVLMIGIQLCQALRFLHRQSPPIIFRDVKPANIMRTPKGRFYLIDFGIARYFRAGKNKDTSPFGSPGYAAPEQYGKAQTTVQTDIYSLGVTLQTLLTGADPLNPSSTPRRPLPHKLRSLLDRMLEPDASKRPHSMDDVKLQLKQIKRRKIAIPLSFIQGFLWASLPYLPILLPFGIASIFPQITTIVLTTIGPLLYPLFMLYMLIFFFSLCFGPFVFVWQLITSIDLLFLPARRVTGLGRLTMLVLLIVAVILERQLLLSLLATWPGD